MMKKQWLWWSMMGLSMGTVWGQRNVKDIKKDFLNPKSTTVLVASHRAAHNQFPENSIPAIKEAIRLGVDILEIDVKVTSDGVPVIMHDGTVNRTTTGKGKLEEMTFAQLNQLFLVENGKATTEKIPTLEEALLLAKGHILVDLDLKTDKMDAVLEVIQKTKTEDIVIFFDSDYEILKYVDKKNKHYMMMPRAHSLSEADSAIALFEPEIVHIDFSFYTPEVVGTIKKHSSRVWINALGPVDAALRAGKTDEALGQLLKHGANVVQTDEPELLLKLLKERKIHL
ncbi:glycerophosphoryl diester phosphodiesterase [Runella defluvii]|uniref:Glycerophosphoryl diester phosphodiesterase n=1 Tax=Runella defluvii TaxID=370973 RepID=A0A7W5ZRP9_9BACT|nr:glycerophosphodiester phosphodiesterase family protein [Runella defluvii]MBB3840439.1 glycerophosphoryl diester phosphodiesterase [Runella defluvii]